MSDVSLNERELLQSMPSEEVTDVKYIPDQTPVYKPPLEEDE
ncbi:hypothetical protein [Turicimonas muris]|nr:hypothetical protein [Turicimonas muris]